jgi:hypothetical protein
MHEFMIFGRHLFGMLRFVRGVLLSLFLVLIASALVISALHGIPISDALYFTFITALTVGFGDITPASGLIPGIAAVIEDILVGLEDAVREPVVAYELPDVFDRVQFGRSRRQWQEGDVVGHLEGLGAVPAGLVENDDGVGSFFYGLGDFYQMQAHGFRIAAGQDQARGLSLSRTDGTKEEGRASALVTGC